MGTGAGLEVQNRQEEQMRRKFDKHFFFFLSSLLCDDEVQRGALGCVRRCFVGLTPVYENTREGAKGVFFDGAT